MIRGSFRGGGRKAAPPTTPLESASELYLEALRVQQYSEHTLHTRRKQLRVFLDWCGERGLREPHEVTRAVLESYQRHLFYYRKPNGEPLSFNTQHGRCEPLRMWFRWLTRRNYLLHNPASELELPRQGYRLPKHVLTVEEVERVLQQPDLEDPQGVRDRTMLEVLYSTGMRRMELVGLSLYDLDLDGGTLKIREGKGRKDRIVPIGERAVAWMRKYLREVREAWAAEPDDGTVFLTHAGEEMNLAHVSHLVHDYVARARIGKSGSAHLLRHTCATLLFEGGADIRHVQAILGHASLRTTEIYTHVSIRLLKLVHSAAHPGAALTPPEARPDRGNEPVTAPSSPPPLPPAPPSVSRVQWSRAERNQRGG